MGERRCPNNKVKYFYNTCWGLGLEKDRCLWLMYAFFNVGASQFFIYILLLYHIELIAIIISKCKRRKPAVLAWYSLFSELELFLGEQHLGAVTVCSFPTSCHHSEFTQFCTTMSAKRLKLNSLKLTRATAQRYWSDG